MRLPIARSLPADRARVFEALHDPDTLRQCIEGCEAMTKAADGTYDVRLKVGLAGFKGSYTGKVKISEQRAPESLTLQVEGKGASGFIRATARLRLEPKDASTQLTGEADATVGGVIASVGSRLIEAAAKKMMADFFARFEGRLTSRSVS